MVGLNSPIDAGEGRSRRISAAFLGVGVGRLTEAKAGARSRRRDYFSCPEAPSEQHGRTAELWWKAEISRTAAHAEPYSCPHCRSGCAMKRAWFARALTILLLAPSLGLQTASAQQRGGILKVYHWVSPASMSIYEEAGYSASVSGMGCSIISFFTSKTSSRTVWDQSCRNSPANGPGTMTGPY